MLIIPLTGKISLRNPPVITISLVLINCLVFLLFQLNEDKYYIEAEQYYFESGLAEIEFSKYIEYKYPDDHQELPENFNEKSLRGEYGRKYIEMRQDSAFEEKLEAGDIITPDDPDYLEWKNLRREYTRKLSKVVTISFGFKPADPSIITLFTHMFLHGGIGHLFGNMIFLWLAGCLLEMGSGRIYYFTTYIFTGLCAVGMFWLWNMNSPAPLVGASGAISGLMGALTVLYGRKKIKTFYSLGVYFNYIKIRAIYLLPLWVGTEVYQLAFSEIRHIAYLAHLGGLLSGALLGFINKKFLGFYKEDAVEPEPEDEISPLLEKAMEHISRLEMEKGAKILNDILDKDPENLIALKHLFDIYKIKSEDKKFHLLTKRLLLLISKNEATHKLTIEVYSEYLKRAKQPKLPAELYLRLIPIFSNHGHPEKAEHILTMFLNKKPDFPGLSAVLLKVANGYKIKGNHKQQRKFLNILCSKYADSPEARLGNIDLSKLSNE